VRVYEVVAVGLTCVDPANATVPILVMETLSALVTFHDSVDVPPGAMVAGFAVNETTVGV
jgi:hypothetical protein